MIITTMMTSMKSEIIMIRKDILEIESIEMPNCWLLYITEESVHSHRDIKRNYGFIDHQAMILYFMGL